MTNKKRIFDENLTGKQRASRHYKLNALRKKAAEIFKRATLWPFTKNFRSDRLLNAQLMSITNLPVKWTDKDMQNAEAALWKLQKELKIENRSTATLRLVNILALILADSGAKDEEKAQALFDTMNYLGTNMLKKPPQNPTEAVVLCYLAENQPRALPDWYLDALVDLLMKRLNQQQAVHFSNAVYNRVAAALDLPDTSGVADGTEEDDDGIPPEERL